MLQAGNRDRDPNHPMFGQPVPQLPPVPTDSTAFRLVAPREMQRLLPGQAGTLLSGGMKAWCQCGTSSPR